MNLCDKCGKPVEPANDAVHLHAQVMAKLGDPMGAMVLAVSATQQRTTRHLLPVGDCEGSPSRAQYLEGQPRDKRPQYPYDKRIEQVMRECYAIMQSDRPTVQGVAL